MCSFRAAPASVASPAACSRRAKSTSRATAAPPTGPTEMTSKMWRRERETARESKRGQGATGPHPRHVTDDIITGTNHFTTQAKKTHYDRPPPPLLLCISPLFKFMAVVCKIYLCMYLYSIYVLVGHKNVVFCILFFFYFEGHFISKKCGKMRMLNHGDEVGEYTWTQASCDVDFFSCMHTYIENDVHRVYTSFSWHRHFFYF